MQYVTTRKRRAALALATTALTTYLLAAAMSPAHAAGLVTVPAGCGSLSGTQVPANQLDDHSGDTVALGTATTAYRTKAVTGMITVGTAFDDNIQGTNGVFDTICGENGNDTLGGAGGNDTIYGDFGDDTIAGGDGADT